MIRIDDIPVCGHPIDEGALNQIKNCRKFCDGAALMADHHKGYSIPIGGVLWSKDRVSPSAVGFDIGCGNKVIRTNLKRSDIAQDMSPIMDQVQADVSFGIGRTANWKVDHKLFDSETWKTIEKLPDSDFGHAKLKQQAQAQLGTVGSGNHYVDIFHDEEDRIWVGVHFGSRGLGHKLASYFLRAGGQTSDDMDANPLFFDAASQLGADYIECMNLAGEYAYAGRDAVCSKVLEILGATSQEEIHCHHNFAWLETHNGSDYWVMRKGATPAFPGQKGFVGATMCEPSVIIEGVESGDSRELFYSTIHGAGRTMSRTQARGRTDRRTGLLKLDEHGVPIKPPQITQDMMKEWVERSSIVLRGADVDESPFCYKRLSEVLTDQGDSIRVFHHLVPMGVAMASRDVYDPYKD